MREDTQKEDGIPTGVLVAILLLVFLLALAVLLLREDSGKAQAQIHQSGELIAEITFPVAEPYSIVLNSQGRINEILVNAEEILMKEANCPDQVCVLQGASNVSPIICLPHQIIISFSTENQWTGLEGGELDGVTG